MVKTKIKRHGKVFGALILVVAVILTLHFYYGVFIFGQKQAEAADFNYVVDSAGSQFDDNAGDGICHTAVGTCTYYAAIQEANADGGTSAITFSITGTITMLAGTGFNISAPVSITGPGEANLTINGNGDAGISPLYFDSGSGGSSATALTLAGCGLAGSPGTRQCIKLPSTDDGYSFTQMTFTNGSIRCGQNGNDDITITNNTFTGVDGIINFADNAVVNDNINISDNTFTINDPANEEQVMKINGSNVTVHGNTIDCTSSGIGAGIFIHGASGYTVTDNELTECGLTADAGGNGSIYISPGDDASPMVITGNTITGGEGHGIWVNTTSDNSYTGFDVSDNIISNTGSYGIIFGVNGAGYTSLSGVIDGNVITNAGASVPDNEEMGIGVFNLDSDSDLTVSNNDISGSGAYGLLLYNVDDTVVVTGNTSSSNDAGIFFLNCSGEVSISNNTFESNEFAGVTFDENTTITGGTIAGNTFNSNPTGIALGTAISNVTIGGSGAAKNIFDNNEIAINIDSLGVSAITIQGNEITDSTDSGIVTTSGCGADISIINNIISGSALYGVNLNGCEEAVTFSGNTISNNGSTTSSGFMAAVSPGPTYDGDVYSGVYFYAGGGGGELIELSGSTALGDTADGVHNFNLSLIDIDAAFYAFFVRDDAFASSGAFETECNTWGVGTCTAVTWQDDIFVAHGATSSYTLNLTGPGIVFSVDPTLTYATGIYLYYGYYLSVAAHTITNDTFSGNGNGIYFGIGPETGASCTVTDSVISSLNSDFVTDFGDSSFSVINTTYTTYTSTHNVTINHQVRVHVIDVDGDAVAATVTATNAGGTASSMGTTDASGLTSYVTLSHDLVEGEDLDSPFIFSAALSGKTGTTTATYLNTKNQQVELTIASSGPAPVTSSACSNGTDDDGDGYTDYLDDPGCASASDNNEANDPACSDRVDNDGDGKIDALDFGCLDSNGVYDKYDNDETNSLTLPECSDSLDNDNDGYVDFPVDPGCANAVDPSENPNPACSDGLDNDKDGLIDYPADMGCTSIFDIDETTPVISACSDGIDNDKDGKIDMADPGCSSIFDTNESDTIKAACADGLDNDSDGKIDYPADDGCFAAFDESEIGASLAACSDGLDNDEDGLIDWPEDPGCLSVFDSDENNVTIKAQCADGLDNDADGGCDHGGCTIVGVKLPADLSCSSPADNDEFLPLSQCQDGRDNDGDNTYDYQSANPDSGCSSTQDDSEVAEVSVCGNSIREAGETCDDGNLTNGDGCSSACIIEDSTEFCFYEDFNSSPLSTSKWRSAGRFTSLNYTTTNGKYVFDLQGVGDSLYYEQLLSLYNQTKDYSYKTAANTYMAQNNKYLGLIPLSGGKRLAVLDDFKVEINFSNFNQEGNPYYAAWRALIVLCQDDNTSLRMELLRKSDRTQATFNGYAPPGIPTYSDFSLNSSSGQFAIERQNNSLSFYVDGLKFHQMNLVYLPRVCYTYFDSDVQFTGNRLQVSVDEFKINKGCYLSICGDGIVDKVTGETCDDGNLVDGDGCSSACTIEERKASVCGNGVKESGEECDDGTINGQEGRCNTSCSGTVVSTEEPIVEEPIIEEPKQEEPETEEPLITEGKQESTVTQTVSEVTSAISGFVGEVSVKGQEIVSSIAGFLSSEQARPMTEEYQVMESIPVLRQIAETNAYQTISKTVLDNKAVERANVSIATPAVIAITAANALAALPSLSLIPNLALIFTEPFRLLFFRKRKYGVIYNSLSKKPIDLAIVRLYDNVTNKLVATAVTDSHGRYSFLADPGEYYIKVQSPNYVFPSSTLGQKIKDHDYADLYYGAPVRTTDQSSSLTLNIPLDPNIPTKTDKEVLRADMIKKFKAFIAHFGLILSFGSLIISPNKLVLLVVVFHILLFIFFRRIATTHKPKSYGVIFDQDTKKAINKTILRIFDNQYNKLLATAVANSKGQYNFLVGPNVYYLTANHPSYQPFKSDVLDFGNAKEAVVDKDIRMKKK
ncbi:MAG: right-handed parallel beta-helix repeat-containing protein [Patescibacteria group bacterium]|jgi:hypothetical protein